MEGSEDRARGTVIVFIRNDKTYFLSKIIILEVKFFCIIESSICVPTDLGSNATLTPVPKIPLEPTPTQLANNKNVNMMKKNLVFIFFC